MRRLDGYLIRMFLAPFGVATFALIGLLLIADVLSNVNQFIQNSTGFWDTSRLIAAIYTLKVPSFLTTIAPMTMLVGAAFGMSQLSKNNELTAMKACGVSLLRAMAPVFAAAAVLSVLAGLVREYVVPPAEQLAIPLFYTAKGDEDRFADVLGVVPEQNSVLTEVPASSGGQGVWRLEADEPAFHARYSFIQRRMRNLTIVFSPADGRIIRVEAAEAVYVPPREDLPGMWRLDKVRVDQGEEMDHAVWLTRLLPRDLAMHRLPLQVQPIHVVMRFVQSHPALPQYRVMLYSRLTYPLTGVILLMLGLPLVLGNERLLNSRLLGMGAAVLICLGYFGVQFLSYHLGDNDQLPPAVAVLAPVVCGIGAGGYLLDTIRT